MVQDINPPGVAGSAIGLNNMAVIISGLFCQPLVGYILRHVWSGGMRDGVPFYTVHNYHAALWMVPLISLLGFVVAMVVYHVLRRWGRDNKYTNWMVD